MKLMTAKEAQAMSKEHSDITKTKRFDSVMEMISMRINGAAQIGSYSCFIKSVEIAPWNGMEFERKLVEAITKKMIELGYVCTVGRSDGSKITAYDNYLDYKIYISWNPA